MSDYNRNRSPGDSGGGTNNSPPAGNRFSTPPRVITSNGVVELFSDKNTVMIEALGELSTKGYIPDYYITMPLVNKSVELISSLGYAIVDTEELSPGLQGTLKNFSLRGSVNIDETIENSKIVDPDLPTLTPAKHSAEDKFKSEDDPFYDLDEERSESIKRQEKQSKYADDIAMTILARHLTEVVRLSPSNLLDRSNKRKIKK